MHDAGSNRGHGGRPLPVDFGARSNLDEVVNHGRICRFGGDATGGIAPSAVEHVSIAIHRPGMEAVETIWIESRPIHEVGVSVRGVLQALDLLVNPVFADRG